MKVEPQFFGSLSVLDTTGLEDLNRIPPGKVGRRLLLPITDTTELTRVSSPEAEERDLRQLAATDVSVDPATQSLRG